jgi:hypothetical protein
MEDTRRGGYETLEPARASGGKRHVVNALILSVSFFFIFFAYSYALPSSPETICNLRDLKPQMVVSRFYENQLEIIYLSINWEKGSERSSVTFGCSRLAVFAGCVAPCVALRCWPLNAIHSDHLACQVLGHTHSTRSLLPNHAGPRKT